MPYDKDTSFNAAVTNFAAVKDNNNYSSEQNKVLPWAVCKEEKLFLLAYMFSWKRMATEHCFMYF